MATFFDMEFSEHSQREQNTQQTTSMMHPTGLIVAVILTIIICQVHVTLASVKVIDLSTNNHEYTLNRRTPTLVLFHTQWCYTCKQILPEFLNVAEYVSSPLQIAKIDCDEEYEVCMKYGVTGYPVIQLIVKGSGQMFQGEATAHNLVQYLNEKIGSKFPLPDPPATIDSTLSGVTEMTIESADSDLAAKKATLILYYAPWCGFCQMLTPEYATVGRLASKQKDVQIAKVNCDSASPVCVKQNIHAFPTIKLYLDETKEYFEYNGERVASEIIAFVNQHAKSNIEGGVELVKVPTAMNPEVVVDGITELTSENADKIVSGHKATMIMFYAPWCNYCKALAPIYAQLGPIAKDDEFVTVAKVNCQGHGELCRKYSVHSYPTIKFLPYGSKDAIEYTWNRNIQDLVLFLNQKGGSHLVAPPAPGAPPPKKGAPDEIVPGIIEVTSHNYQAILDGSKNVFIEFYAPWCGHCKHCAPEFAKFGPIMQKNADSGLIIAKVNCDHEGEICGEKYNVWAYPTFRLYHSGNQDQFTPYLGERTIDTFLQFVNGHTGLDLKVIKQQTHWLTRDEL